jgi:hypothetical protein
MSVNAFFRDNESLYNKSSELNCKSINCLSEFYDKSNKDKLNNNLSCSSNNTRRIRNVDFERPMMWCEYRFKHLNYCNNVNVGGFVVCQDCKGCGFHKNINLNDPDNKKTFENQK